MANRALFIEIHIISNLELIYICILVYSGSVLSRQYTHQSLIRRKGWEGFLGADASTGEGFVEVETLAISFSGSLMLSLRGEAFGGCTH